MTEIDKSIEETLVTSDLTKINIDLAELSIDSLLDEGIIKDLPIVSSIVRLVNSGIKIQEFIFLKKVLKFLTKLNSTTKEERIIFIKNIEKSENYNKKVGLALMLIIDKLEDLEKPEIIGKLFAASVKGEIDYKTFLRLSYIVQKLFIPDLEYLKQIKRGIEIDYEKKDELYLSGLMVTTDTGGARFDGKNEYVISPNGLTLLSIID